MNRQAAQKKPGSLRRAVKPLKSRLQLMSCAFTERLISSASAYDILVLFGMRRSGNHLAINWILGQIPGSAVFYNNIRQNGHPFDVGMREYRLRWPNRRPKIILSYEDLTPDEIAAGPLTEFLSDRVTRHNVTVQSGVILRDPYNLFASRLKKWPERFATDEAVAAQKKLYERHAVLAVDPKPLFGGAPVTPILYNRLVADQAYRKNLANELKINAGDVGLNEVPVYGHGSSFDGYKTDGANVRTGVFDRWKSSMNDPTFRQLVDDKLIQQRAKEIFGMEAPG